MRKYVGVSLLFVVMAVVAIFGTVCHSASSADKPSPDFIAAAVLDQEAAGGAALDVTYVQTLPRTDGKTATPISVHYVRTRGILFSEESRTEGEIAIKRTASYDRNLKQYQALLKGADKAAGEVAGWPVAFQSTQLPDPIEYFLGPGTVAEMIGLGTVGDAMEMIDGHQCWRVDIMKPRPDRSRYTIWVDPDVGFCPRRIDLVQEPNVLIVSSSFQDYAPVEGKVWFPMKQVVKSFIGDEALVTVSAVTSVRLIPIPQDDSLQVKFPSGTRVSVTGTDTVFTQP